MEDTITTVSLGVTTAPNGIFQDMGLHFNQSASAANSHNVTQMDDTISISPQYSMAETIVIVFFLTLLVFCSVAGNLLVCISILTDRKLRKTSNYFIISLAVADMCMATLVMSFAGSNDVIGYWVSMTLLVTFLV